MSENWKLQASYKFGPGQQAMLNIRADDAPELKTTLDSLVSLDVISDLSSTGSIIAAVDSVVAADAAPAIPAQAAPSPLESLRANAYPAVPPILQGAPAAAEAPATPAPGGAVVAPTCIHGQKTFLRKPSKNKPGEFWAAWACPADQHDPTKCKLDFNVPAHLKG